MTAVERGAKYYGHIVDALAESDRQGPLKLEPAYPGSRGVWKVQGRVIKRSADVLYALKRWEHRSGIRAQ